MAWGSADRKRRLRHKVIERDGDKCAHCHAPHPHILDHIIPRCAGGRSHIHNMQLICSDCDKNKQEKPDPYRRGQIKKGEQAAIDYVLWATSFGILDKYPLDEVKIGAKMNLNEAYSLSTQELKQRLWDAGHDLWRESREEVLAFIALMQDLDNMEDTQDGRDS